MSNRNTIILKLAQRVRAWAEEHVCSLPSSYDFESNLACMCAYASTVLLAYLHYHGFTEAQLAHNDSHAFILIDNKVLDVTATQFYRKRADLHFKPVEFCLPTTIRRKAVEWESPCWSVEFLAQDVDDAYNQLRPTDKKSPYYPGFPTSQYWSKRQNMNKTIEKAIEACEKMTHIKV